MAKRGRKPNPEKRKRKSVYYGREHSHHEVNKTEHREIKSRPDPAGCPICGALVSVMGGLKVCANGHSLYLFGHDSDRDHRPRGGGGHVLGAPGSDEQTRAPRRRGRIDIGLDHLIEE